MTVKQALMEHLRNWQWLQGRADNMLNRLDRMLGSDSDRRGIMGVLQTTRDEIRELSERDIPTQSAVARETAAMMGELIAEQNRANAKFPRRPKTPVTDEESAVAKAREVFPAKLAEVPEGHGQISKALTKTMNVEFAPGKRIGDYQDKEQLRQKLTRKKSCKSGAID